MPQHRPVVYNAMHTHAFSYMSLRHDVPGWHNGVRLAKLRGQGDGQEELIMPVTAGDGGGYLRLRETYSAR